MVDSGHGVVFLALAVAGVLVLAVPAECRADATVLPVARFAIYPGDSISDQMLEDRQLQLRPGMAAGAIAERSRIVGKVAKRTLLPGQAIPLNALKEPDVVKSGKSVMLQFAAGELVITARGLALQSGSVGDVISIQSSETAIVVRGIVQADGTIRVGE
jgi:flagellar basal body P-ring formation protein FlgA